jgi:AcrR family transcriptional regulator
MSSALADVRRAARRRADAHTEYLAAVRAARAGGATLQQIADAAGVTKAAVWQQLTRGEK